MATVNGYFCTLSTSVFEVAGYHTCRTLCPIGARKKLGLQTKHFSLVTELLKHFNLIRTGVVFLELSKFSKHLFHGRL